MSQSLVLDDLLGSPPALTLIRGRAGVPRVTVVIPAMNEAKNLPLVLSRLPEDLYEVILVDGHSTDDTIAVARELVPDLKVVTQTRRGKGNAMACGFAASHGDIIVMLDADGSAKPEEIPQFVDALLAGADFAKGSRFIAGGGSCDITPIRRLGNSVLNVVVSVLFATRYSDLCYGYNAFWADCLPAIDVVAGSRDPSIPGEGTRWGDGFEIETILNVRIAKARLAVTEVPSFEDARMHGESNLNTFRDGWRVLVTIARERFRRSPRERPVLELVPEGLAHGI